MKYFLLLILMWSKVAMSELNVIAPPLGLTPFWLFDARTEFESEAFSAAKLYFKDKNERLNDYYLVSSSLDISTGLYSFYIVHRSTYNESRKVMDESYKNGEIFFDIRKNKIVKFERKKH